MQCPIAADVNDRKLSDIKVSQGSVATRLTSDGIFSNYFTVNLPPNLPCLKRKSKIDRTGKNTYIDIFFRLAMYFQTCITVHLLSVLAHCRWANFAEKTFYKLSF